MTGLAANKDSNAPQPAGSRDALIFFHLKRWAHSVISIISSKKFLKIEHRWIPNRNLATSYTVDFLFSEIQGTKEKLNLVPLHSNIFVKKDRF